MIMGNLPLNDTPSEVLFDFGASRCFMSRPFFAKHDFSWSYLDKPLCIISPGELMSSNLVIPDVAIKLGNYKFLASPIVLGDSDIDLILAMDWLSQHKAYLDFAAREIKLMHPYEDVIIYAARDETIRLFSLNEKGELDTIS